MYRLFSQLLKPAKTVEFSDSCASCALPCIAEAHRKIPEYLADKISQETMVDSVKPYVAHILINIGAQQAWGSDVNTEATISDLKLKFDASGTKVLITAYEGPHKMIVLPINKSVSNIADWDKFVNWVVSSQVDGASTDGFELAETSYRHMILVCTHSKRDKRCGVQGAILVDQFKSFQTNCFPVSHVGGHKFAGNVIVYHYPKLPAIQRQGESNEGARAVQFVADWYGRVTSCHVASIVTETVEKGLVVKELWRGRAGNGSTGKTANDW